MATGPTWHPRVPARYRRRGLTDAVWLVERSRRMADRPQHSAAPIAPTQRSSWLRRHRSTHALALDRHPTPSLLPGLLGHQPPATTRAVDRHHRPSVHRRRRAPFDKRRPATTTPPIHHFHLLHSSTIVRGKLTTWLLSYSCSERYKNNLYERRVGRSPAHNLF